MYNFAFGTTTYAISCRDSVSPKHAYVKGSCEGRLHLVTHHSTDQVQVPEPLHYDSSVTLAILQRYLCEKYGEYTGEN